MSASNLVILNLEGPNGLMQLTFRLDEGCRAPLRVEALLLPVFPLLAELLLLSRGLFLGALKLWCGPSLPMNSTRVLGPGGRVGDL